MSDIVKRVTALAESWGGRVAYCRFADTPEDKFEAVVVRFIDGDDAATVGMSLYRPMNGEDIRLVMSASDLYWTIDNPIPYEAPE